MDSIGKTRRIAISRVLREQRPTDGPTDRVAYRVACTRLINGCFDVLEDALGLGGQPIGSEGQTWETEGHL